MRRKDMHNLERVINECVAAGMPELDEEISKARELLEELGKTPEGWPCFRMLLKIFSLYLS